MKLSGPQRFQLIKQYLMKSKILHILLFVSLLLTSCNHKEILTLDGVRREINVSFDWQYAEHERVDGMTVYCYSLDEGGEDWRFELAGCEGGKIELPPGHYRVVAYNNDLPGVMMTRTESYYTITACARKKTESTYMQTGTMYLSEIPELDVLPCGISYIDASGKRTSGPDKPMICTPDTLTTLYEVCLGDIKGLENVVSAGFMLEGIACQTKLCNGDCEGITADVQSVLRIEEGKSEGDCLSGFLTGFGIPAENPRIMLNIRIELADGKWISKSMDVTAQVAASPYRHHVIIKIDGLELPDMPVTPPDPDQDVGMDVEVDGWTVIEIDYETQNR